MSVKALPTRKMMGAAIRFGRVEKGLTQLQLARKAGISQPTISEMERGGFHDFDHVTRIARALGLRTSQLIQAAEVLESTRGALKGLINTAAELTSVLEPEEMHALFDQAAGQ